MSAPRREVTPVKVTFARAIFDLTASLGVPPTARELSEATGRRSLNGVKQTIERLVRDGFAMRLNVGQRSVVLTEKGLELIGEDPSPERRIAKALDIIAKHGGYE